MTAPLQPQLDDFARRLHALEAELTDLRQQAELAGWAEEHLVSEPKPSAPRRVASPELSQVLACIEAGDLKHALKQLERVRRRALTSQNEERLDEVLQLAHEVAAQASGGKRVSADQLAYAAEQNLKYVKRMRAILAKEEAAPAPMQVQASAVRTPAFQLPELHASDLLGARALALAGGCVTLLGVLFFFVLAVNRGWIGPVGRVGLGATASAAVFVAGLWVRRRYGETDSALAAVGAGIAGGYGTLLAAAALYDLVPDYAALGIAAAIAATGVVTALRWRSQIIAGLGLIGAMLVPVAVIAQGGLSVLGTAFVAFMLAATATVAVRERWNGLIVAGTLVAAPQIAALAFRSEYRGEAPVRIVVLAAIFSLLYLAIGIANQLRSGAERLGQLTTAPITGAALLAGGSAARLYGSTTQRGVALLVIALVFAVVATVFFRRRAWRDLSALIAAVAFTVGAIGLSEVLSGQTLVYAWAAEAAALAWLARRTSEVRFQMWSIAYLVLALVHVLGIDAPPRLLFRAGAGPLHGAAPAAVIALVALISARYSHVWEKRAVGPAFLGYLTRLIRAFEAEQEELRAAALWLATIFGTYALSLTVLSAFGNFGWAHVTLSAIWSAIGIAILLGGLLRKSARLRAGGLVWLGATTLLVIVHGAVALESSPRAASFVVVATALLGTSLAYQLIGRRKRLSEIGAGSAALSVGLTWVAVVTLLHSRAGQGAALLGVSALYVVLAVALFGRREQRDFTTLLWAIASVLAATSAALLVGGTYLVLCWAAGGAALAWLSVRAREPRFTVPSTAALAAAFVHGLVFEAPLSHFFTARSNPATGVPALLIIAIGAAILAYHARGDVFGLHGLRIASWWIAGVLTVYGVSLSILELLQHAFPHASLHTDFQRGHTAVSAFWGLLGLVLLYFGLTRWRSLRIAGFALFAVSLAKIFLYDLPSLSSITRALSFLAVGAVLLLGGFFYQRLTASQDEQHSGDDFASPAET